MNKIRTVYIAQVNDHRFQVSFNCQPNDCPINRNADTSRKIRTYDHVTLDSIRRLNCLVYLAPKNVKTSAHLFPYICIWVTFPRKVKASHV
jgi:hypothetical protein